MENRFKVELWIDELTKTLSSSNAFKFDHNNDNALRIINENYGSIFDCLIKNKSIRIANLEFDDNDFYHVFEEQQNNSILYNSITIFTSSKKETQNARLDKFLKENEEYFKKHSTCLFYITFGLLDYYDIDNKHTIASAPLLFLPIKISYNKEEDFYQIKLHNKEIHFNEQLINYIRRSKKVDISYPLDQNFVLDEYLLYVASKVHMFHWSVNNGCFIAKFDINSQFYLEDIVEHQSQIANNPLVKSISYFNAEFYNFVKNDKNKLNKKFLSLLPVDNEEYRILKRVSDRESLFIRTNNFKNKSHILNNIILNYLLNNKKVLVVYENQEQKRALFDAFDTSILPYVYDLNEITSDKTELLNRLNKYESTTFVKDFFDPVSTQEILNKYYDTKNNFKILINELRKKNEQFNLSLNECIEHYYRLECPLIETEIKKIDSFNTEMFETLELQISDFVTSLRKLKVPYKQHAFYGFNKNSMMQEEYLPLKEASEHLSKDIKMFQKGLHRLNVKYAFPLCKNLKEAKAVLNILSIVPFYRKNSALWKKAISFDMEKIKMQSAEKVHQEYVSLLAKIKENYGDKVFDLSKEMLTRYNTKKNFSKKELVKYRPYFKEDVAINLNLLSEVDEQIKYLNEVREQYDTLIDTIDDAFNAYWYDDHYDFAQINLMEEKVAIFNNAIKFLNKNKVVYSAKELEAFEDEQKYNALSALRMRLQIIFNRILKHSKVLQEYFDVNLIDYSVLNFHEFYNKVEAMADDFISINDYLDFYVARQRLNNLNRGLADGLLTIEDFNLYELMFYKRFYYDYAMYLLNKAKLRNYKQEDFYHSLDVYNISEQNRSSLVDSLLKNYHLTYIRNNLSMLRRYEYDFIEEEKKREFIRPLSRITSLAHESVFHMLPCIFTPLKTLSKLLNNEDYHYDVAICLFNKNVKTSEVLSLLYKEDQMLVFEEDYLEHKYVEEHIDKYDTEVFLSAVKNSYETIEFVSKTYNVKSLQANHANPYFKNYLQSFLEKSGFKVARNVSFKEGTLDFVVKVANKKTYSAIIVDRLPYYSLESTQESILLEEKLLKDEYPLIRIFPFTFFLNEEQEKQKLINQILENSNIEKAKTKIVKKKITDMIFLPYQEPHQVYYQNKAKYSFDRAELFNKVLNECAPILQSELLGIFPTDGLAYLTSLLKQEKVYIKDHFIFIKDKDVVFKSAKNQSLQRNIKSVAREEIEEGILSIIKTCETIEIENVIKMILISLNYKVMNAKLYEYVHDIIIKMVHRKILSLQGNMLTLFMEKEEPVVVQKVMLKRE